MIQLEHLSKTFPGKDSVHALRDVSLTVRKGEIYGVIGYSGAGKSTLIRCINLLERPDEGTVRVDGVELTALGACALNRERRKIGMIFQQFNLFATRTALDNVAYPLRFSGMSRRDIREKAESLLRYVELEDKRDAYPSQLSGGQKQRVAIAGVIAMEPRVLVLDEPTAGLDPRGRDDILARIQDYHRAKHASVVLVSHSMEEIARNVDRIAVLSDGHVFMEGTPRQVFTRADELEQVGLDIPQVTKVALILRQRGLPVDTAVYTVEALRDALLRLKGGDAVC